jgi:Type IV secretion system pilin
MKLQHTGKIIMLSAITATSIPSAAALAAGVDTSKGLGKLFAMIGNLANMAIGILVTLAIVVFFWGLVVYIFKLGSSKGPEANRGRNLMVYGIVALFVMVSVWGIVNFIGDFFGLEQADNNGPTVSNLLPKINTN